MTSQYGESLGNSIESSSILCLLKIASCYQQGHAGIETAQVEFSSS